MSGVGYQSQRDLQLVCCSWAQALKLCLLGSCRAGRGRGSQPLRVLLDAAGVGMQAPSACPVPPPVAAPVAASECRCHRCRCRRRSPISPAPARALVLIPFVLRPCAADPARAHDVMLPSCCEDSVSCVKFAPNNNFLAVTSWDNSCSVYNYQVSRWQLHALSVAVSEEEWS